MPKNGAGLSPLQNQDQLSNQTIRFIRHPPDDGLVEAKIATFDGFWQFQTLDTGLSCSQPATLAAERRKCRICCHPDAPLPWVSLERMTIKDFTRVLDQAAAPWLTTLAPILMSFSFKVVIDQSLIGSGVANVRKKLPRL